MSTWPRLNIATIYTMSGVVSEGKMNTTAWYDTNSKKDTENILIDRE